MLWDVFFDVLITLSEGVSALGMFYYISKLYRNFNKRRLSPAQATTTEWTAKKSLEKRVQSYRMPKHKTEQTDGRNIASSGNNAKGNVD